VSFAAGQTPTVTDHRLVLELVAREPDIVTPTGIAVDERGRVWAIENNTHQRAPSYQGPPSDRIRIFENFDAQGYARTIRTFAEGFRNAMSLALGKDGSVYLATRSDIYVLHESSRTGQAPEQRVIVRLDTPGDYPHNGLAGFAFDGLGNMYFSLGENLGAAYKLIGSDGTTLQGGGEGGSIYRCRPDGSGLVRIATGFWNTFHLTVDAFGRLFAVDNDPDARGPCRLLHIVAGGDYGYRFRNGRKGLHPFTAWNGELPGTLPMVAGTAEAPSGIVAYESTGLPAEYRGNLLVTSWGDHVVERFELTPRGASFGARARALIRGDENFRPVGIVTAPDGALYLTDWVDKSYPVHGKGRIWRLRMKRAPADDGLRPSQVATKDVNDLGKLFCDPRREIRAAAGEALTRPGRASQQILAEFLAKENNLRARMQALWAAGRLEPSPAAALLTKALDDSAAEVRGEAARILGQRTAGTSEQRFLDLAQHDPSAFVRMQAIGQLRTRTSLEAILPIVADKDPFLAGAAIDALGRSGNAIFLLPHAGVKETKVRLGVLMALRRTGDAAGRAALSRFLEDSDPAVRRAAIQWVGEDHLREFAPQLDASAARPPVTREVFEALLAAKDILAGRSRQPGDESSGQDYIAKVVRDANKPAAIRAIALQMLRPDHPGLDAALLRQFIDHPDAALRREASRTLALRSDGPSQKLLRDLAGDEKREPKLRATAVFGLAHSAFLFRTTRLFLVDMLTEPALRRDALRSLRGAAGAAETQYWLLAWWFASAREFASDQERQELAEQLLLVFGSKMYSDTEKRRQAIAAAAGPLPRSEKEWRAAAAGKGDPAAGERVFFHPRGPGCATCHRVDGRGGLIGPDLSGIGRALDREKLIDSILLPSKEIAPQYVTWAITTRDGKLHTGVLVDEGWDSNLTLADSQGKLETIHRTMVEDRQALPKSIMPDNLTSLMTRQEFRDLLAFLVERK
jgi:putative membrane-bound dehydrogenase-like protein